MTFSGLLKDEQLICVWCPIMSEDCRSDCVFYEGYMPWDEVGPECGDKEACGLKSAIYALWKIAAMVEHTASNVAAK